MDQRTRTILLSLVAAGATAAVATYIYKKYTAGATVEIEFVHTEWLTTMAEKYTGGDGAAALQLLVDHCISTSKADTAVSEKIFKEVRCKTCGKKQRVNYPLALSSEDSEFLDEVVAKYEIKGGADKAVRIMFDYAMNDTSADLDAIFKSA